MQQYFIKENYNKQNFILSKDDSYHITKVMRKKVGDKVFVAFLNNKRYVCELVKVDIETVEIFPIEEVTHSTELDVDITIAIPPLKNDKIEYLIQKATELGVNNIVLFDSERNIAKIKADKFDLKKKRWSKIAKEASEQSKRGIIPTINYEKTIFSLIEKYKDIDYKLIAYENESANIDNNNLSKFLQGDLYKKTVIAIFGSEGGLSANEVKVFNDNKYQLVGLGKRILRAETAPLYFISCLAYFSELN
ncbi:MULTISPECIES: 16S rRNA (uracil(1498)-N(3))-methyltransferase [unclassified Gemella]|uniref:RsmE family RNA methyltransferase n=1 Tax=unclassified Gemella TaxID=2624949 RepID=UPI0010739CE7|nr:MULTISPECIES: RsmE family RNA methyltransferase [unclassified Gemella]MBF0710088.1 16S rRNA (uracil(1498)-N(3))-methyltransferase [Gemella sp. GL1.1]MBF0746167.1 16S rRNA (uracil(1498)-N(3))-methyltransferase [Gemella sp. 19428wG2_WT2a]NYS27432.1 16S rRNA (uracil(1498)-N(3))-methyltransferase [Gemella sp. GL1]TFU60452.1 16S rRNA (uracil(1498)-N(3))-methyltransferase [Gemella sp. WT2a]